MDSVRALLDLVRVLGRLLDAEQRHRGVEHQLQSVHVRALLYLARANRFSNTPQALTEFLGQTKGTVSQSLKLLVERDLVVRETDTEDRRVVRLRLSRKGRDMVDGFNVEDRWMTAARTVSAPRIDAAAAAMRELLVSLQADNGRRSFGVCRSCRHFQTLASDEHRCGLTGEPLSDRDSDLVCREHEWPLSERRA